MPNYEELYYTAKNKYNQAVENVNYIRHTSSELQNQRNNLSRELNQKKDMLVQESNKLSVVQDAEKKCSSIISNEFSVMKTSIQKLSEEYKKVISSDMGVTDIGNIYQEDINKTDSDLNGTLHELQQAKIKLEEQISSLKKDINNCSNELNDTNRRLNSLGSSTYAQFQVGFYYAQMKEYQKKWELSLGF